MKVNIVVHAEIYAQNLPRAITFYEAMFDIKLEKMPSQESDTNIEMWSFPFDKQNGMTSYGAGALLVKMDGFQPGKGGTLIYLNSDDCALQASRAAELGGQLFKEKTSLGAHGFYCLVNDTEGNMIGVHSMQ